MKEREKPAGSKAYRLHFEEEKPKLSSKLRHTESAVDALSDVLSDAAVELESETSVTYFAST